MHPTTTGRPNRLPVFAAASLALVVGALAIAPSAEARRGRGSDDRPRTVSTTVSSTPWSTPVTTVSSVPSSVTPSSTPATTVSSVPSSVTPSSTVNTIDDKGGRGDDDRGGDDRGRNRGRR